MSNQKKSFQRIAQVIMTKPIYKRSAWIIPIEQVSPNVYRTGQDLSFDKMTGKVQLTEEEKAKYPFVIDPTASYRLPDRTKFDITVDGMGVPSVPRDYAMYNLVLLSGDIAKDKIQYDSATMKYIGYFYDKESEAARYNQIDDLRYEAETLIRDAKLDFRKKVALLLNYKMPDKEFFINLSVVSDDVLKRELVKAAREHPEFLMSCFPERNPGVDKEMFVVELLHYNIISQKADGDIYSGSKYIGNSIEDVVKSLSKQDMQPDISKWNIQLAELKGSVPLGERMYAPSPARDNVHTLTPVERFEEYVGRMKAAILDEDVEAAMGYMTHARTSYRDVVKDHPEYKFDFSKYEKMVSGLGIDAKKEALRKGLSEKTLEELQAKIKHHMTAYKEDECKEFWEDKEELINYMVSKK